MIRDSRENFECNPDSLASENLFNSIVIGDQGSGKTSISKSQYKHLKLNSRASNKKIVPLYIDLERTSFGEMKSTIESVFDQIKIIKLQYDKIGVTELVIILDSFDRSKDRSDVVDFIIDNEAQLKFTIFSRNVHEVRLLSSILQIDVTLSNQIFCILEEWETVLQGFNGDNFTDLPEPEF